MHCAYTRTAPMTSDTRPPRRVQGAALILSLASLVGCSRPGIVDHSRVLARVNGHPITRAALDYYLRVRSAAAPLPDTRAQARSLALNEMINTEVLAAAARQEHLEQDPDIHFALVQDHLNLLAHALVTRYLKRHPVTTAELAVAYRQHYRDGGVVEYRARHILVRTRAEASDIIRKLQHGASFRALARQYSEDTVSAQNGGELGWFTKDQMLPTFVLGVANLRRGEISPQPVRTEFGWHVVQLEGRRMASAPPFGKERRALYRTLVAQKITALVARLRANDHISVAPAITPEPPGHLQFAPSVPPPQRSTASGH